MMEHATEGEGAPDLDHGDEEREADVYRSGAAATYRKMARFVATRPRGAGGPGLSRGDRATIRRLRPGQPPPAVFWELMDRLDVPEHDAEELFWIDVLPLMVQVPHRSSRTAGSVLRSSGVSSARVERWLRLDGLRARREARRLLAQLRGKEIEWGSFGQLLRLWDRPELGEKLKRRFARDYFLSRDPARTETNTSEGDK